MTVQAESSADVMESVPNISEGRRLDVVQRIAAAAGAVAGTRVLDVHSDPDHNRSVITIAGRAPAVAESAVRLSSAAVAAIDMREHHGVHPRIGAVDVLPFVPLGSTTMDRCIAVAHEVGERLAVELGIPIYYYGEAALRPERRLLVNIRRGEYELLRDVIATSPASTPDRGPAVLGSAGATAVGARKALIAFNVHLRTDDLRVAQSIARRVRASSGGLPGVQALGLPLPHAGLVQVSMNLTDLDTTPLHVAVAAVQAAARRYGVEIGDGELVGLMPATAALRAAAAALGLPDLKSRQIVDLAVHDAPL
jgi:glutamate formiminotransferase